MRRAVTAGLVATAAAALAGLALVASHAASDDASRRPAASTGSVSTADASRGDLDTTAGRCARPAPSTVAGYRDLFASVDPAQWGAADVSISVPLPDGRVLWLYGDTFSTGRFVHSSAIVQDGGCLRVVNGGAQLLPNEDARHIYWIRSARPATDGSSAVIVTARAITLTGRGPWDFKDGGYDAVTSVPINARGDAPAARLLFLDRVPSPTPDPGPMYGYGPHHFGYARHAHPELRLSNGKHLVTTCQNWDDGKLHPLADYRPIFSEA